MILLKNDIEEQKKKDLETFKKVVKDVADQLPNHTVKEFTFSSLEQQMLAEQQTIIALAQGSQNKIINELCLKRIGVQPSPAIKVRYAIGLGRFVVFVPKETKKTQ